MNTALQPNLLYTVSIHRMYRQNRSWAISLPAARIIVLSLTILSLSGAAINGQQGHEEKAREGSTRRQQPGAGVKTVPQLKPLPMLRQAEPKGWVWVAQTVDISRQLGNEQSVMTLDGEPLPSMLRRRVTLGIVIDNEGHVVTRLIDVSPQNPPKSVSVRSIDTGSVKATFVGMDLVSGLCVLKAESTGLVPASFYSPAVMPARMDIRLYGFSPGQQMTGNASTIYTNPRRNLYQGQITKAYGDFRYQAGSPIYHLTSPPLTATQDGSLILGRSNQLFGLVIYESNGSGTHIVYPISRIQSLARSIISSRQSLRYAWFGATGADVKLAPSTPIFRGSTESLGVRIVAVAPDSPADLAGLKPKDILQSVNDRRITSYAQLATIIRQLAPDSEITFRVRRGAETKLMRARLVPAPAIEPEQQLLIFARRLEEMERDFGQMMAQDKGREALAVRIEKMRNFVSAITAPAPPEIRLRVFYGLETLPLTSQLMNFFAVNQGLLVTTVSDQAKGEQRLRAGDIIIRAGAREVTDINSLLEAIEKSKGQSISLTIVRNREEQRITVPVP
ncbi:MAG: hypothetical protein RIR52_181 [Acidobacteriota bacterium]